MADQASQSFSRDIVLLIWQQFDSLLEEAVLKHSFVGTELLLEHENSLSVIAVNGSTMYKKKCTVPLILAVEQQKFPIIQIFYKYGYSILQPDAPSCNCEQCLSDNLGQTKYRLLALKALSNPLWISLTSEDPFLTSFKLNDLNRMFAQYDDAFEDLYKEVAVTSINFCVKLLDEVQCEDEGEVLMRYNTGASTGDEVINHAFIEFAVDHGQKQVVFHPIIQHYLTSGVFGDIPGWRSSGILYKISFVFFTGLLYPVTTLLSILLPCCPAITNITTKPFVKFVNGAASFITFLVLLAVYSTDHVNGLRNGCSYPNGCECVIFVWVLGFCYGEMQQLHKRGLVSYLKNGWNWVDIAMDTLFVYSFLIWFVIFFYSEDNELKQLLLHLADGAFSVAVILSFFRAIYLCQITSYLGLVQLCLGEMVSVIFQFAFICLVVLSSFTVAMVFLFHASKNSSKVEKQFENATFIGEALSGKFLGFWSTIFTMTYVSLSMKSSTAVTDFNDGTLIQLWANLLFIVYYGITMIVVLNMLIAMMNTSYQRIADNLEMEHKYSRTTLWLEYMSDEQTYPVPFNLLPTKSGIKNCMKKIRSLIGKGKFICPLKDDQRTLVNGAANKRQEMQMSYKELCKQLMDRYLLKEYGLTTDHGYPDEECYLNHDDTFIRKVKSYIDAWTKYQETLTRHWLTRGVGCTYFIGKNSFKLGATTKTKEKFSRGEYASPLKRCRPQSTHTHSQHVYMSANGGKRSVRKRLMKSAI